MIKILIADDHALVRQGIRQCIAEEHDMEVAAEVDAGDNAKDQINNGDCDLVLLDISTPGENGVELLRNLKHVNPKVPVLVLSGISENQYALKIMQAGASGFLNKECAPNQLISAVRTIVNGRKFVSPVLMQNLANGITANHSQRPLHDTLSKREFETFCKLAAGASVSSIAKELNLSVKTISTYRTRVLEKMGMETNADLVTYALTNHLIR